ncbi:telomere length regulation protein-domain-containing protein [Mariannaea sp. PMI_226]|nr:telomere length regulation protein-domain-containing protein [Mariannaea sp. PMI_226]
MNDLFTRVSTTYFKESVQHEPLLTEVKPTASKPDQRVWTVSSVDDALTILKDQPGYDALIKVLSFLNNDEPAADGFRLHVPGPKSASVVNLLVSEIAPNYWTLLLEGSSESNHQTGISGVRDTELFLSCLRSVTALNAILIQIKVLIQEAHAGGKEAKRSHVSLNLGLFLDLLAAILQGYESVRSIWSSSTQYLSNASLRWAQSQKLASLLTNGQVVSVAAEALEIIERDKSRSEVLWITEGVAYSQWLGQNITSWAKTLPQNEELSFCSELFHRSLSLNHSETLIKSVIDGCLLTKPEPSTSFTQIVFSRSRNIKKVLDIILLHLSKKFLSHIHPADVSPNENISAVVTILTALVLSDSERKIALATWCVSSSGAGLGDGIGIRRAVLATLAQDTGAIPTIAMVLSQSLARFGDKLYIKHAAILQQNVHTEVLLLAAGYVHRLSPIKLTMLLRGCSYMSIISNRIGATQQRARFLGLVVGESLSALIDAKETKLNFQMEETETEEAQQLKQLTRLADQPGPVDPILSNFSTQTPTSSSQSIVSTPKSIVKKVKKVKPKQQPPISAVKPRAIIEEIDSSSDEDEDDLVPYEKDSDPEDSDEDATLVQRNKPKAPVYVRDLINFLRDSESYDKQKLALQTAPLLIRRKANYGTEVSSHANELAGLLVGIQDKFDISDFDDLKLQGMVALVVSQPKTMAPWFARTFFEGDYSLSQRTSVLITLGLSARELAGFDVSQYQSAAQFPSKRLHQKMEQLYLEQSNNTQEPSSSRLKALPPSALDNITQSLTTSFLAPLAAEAADATTGPDILKLESFTARYKSTTKVKPRVRAIPNTTAALLATSFFSPLTAHFQMALRSLKPIILNPALLSLYLQTLGIVIHAAGPSTLSLPQLTSELWDLLLGVRVHVLGDVSGMKGWFVAMASLLEVNGGDMRRICETQGRELVETREWVAMVFERTRGEDDGEENEVKMLAAGVLIKLGEAIEKYQAVMMGEMIGFS